MSAAEIVQAAPCRVPGCIWAATNFRPDLPQLAMCTEHRADRMAGRPATIVNNGEPS